MKQEIEQLAAQLSNALQEAYAETGERHYFEAATQMGGVSAQIWMAHNLATSKAA